MSDDNDLPKEPMNPLIQEAVSMHEIFLALIQGGFETQQALYLVAQLSIGKL